LVFLLVSFPLAFPPITYTHFSFLSFIQGIRPSPRLMFIFRHRFIFYGEGLLVPRLTPKLEDHPSSSVRGCLFNIFAANPQAGGPPLVACPRLLIPCIRSLPPSWRTTPCRMSAAAYSVYSQLTPKLEDHPLSPVHGCLFSVFAANVHSWRPSLYPRRGDRDPPKLH
jgi:hypothetical protein